MHRQTVQAATSRSTARVFLDPILRGPSVVVVAVPVGGREGRRWSNPLTRTLGNVAVGMLLMLLSSGVSCSCIGRGGSGDGAACSDHIPNCVRVLACLRTPRSVRGRGGRGFEVDGCTEEPGFFLGAMVDGVIEDEDGDEDDELHTPSGLRK